MQALSDVCSVFISLSVSVTKPHKSFMNNPGLAHAYPYNMYLGVKIGPLQQQRAILHGQPH